MRGGEEVARRAMLGAPLLRMLLCEKVKGEDAASRRFDPGREAASSAAASSKSSLRLV